METALWTPPQERVDASILVSFQRFLAREGYGQRFLAREGYGQRFLAQEGYGSFADYDTLWAWSVAEIAAFWTAFRDFAGLTAQWGRDVLVDGDDLVAARFFPDSRINFAENLLRTNGSDAAIISYTEDGRRRQWSWDELHAQVSRLQQALAAHGVGEGDRVAGLVPNTPEAIAAMLATSSLGAVWSSCSPDFGLAGILDRFRQIAPKVLLCADGHRYGGTAFPARDKICALAKALPCIETIIVFPLIADDPDIAGMNAKILSWKDLLSPYRARRPAFRRVAFNAPVYVMYSSGTTGLPKCILHSAGGCLIQHVKEHRLQCDMRPGDRLFYYTSCGWMMWNWMVSALASGVSLVLYDGSPLYPGSARLADIVQSEKVSHFGASAKYFDACAKIALAPALSHDMSALRTIFSTGSPLAPERFDYVYAKWKKDLCLSSISGGTDIIACFAGASPISPVWRGQCQKRHLAMDVRVFDQTGTSVLGERGELVCCRPHPSMPLGFWNDPGKRRYRDAYFGRYDDVWHHGDYVELTEQGGMRFLGRSDATLNPGGVRIGTAEIYRQVEIMDEIAEAVVIGQDWDDDVRIVLFVRLTDGLFLDDALRQRIARAIRTGASPRHVPAVILQIIDIPRTRSGKIAEIAVRDVVHGREVVNTEALANPEALDIYRDMPQLKRDAPITEKGS